MESLLGWPHFYYQNKGTLKRKWGHYQLGGDNRTTLKQSGHPIALLWGALSQ